MAGLGACERVRRGVTLVSGFMECICFSGVLFGWASLVFVLKSEGYFRERCVNSTDTVENNTDCSSQDEQFSLIFTVASFMNNFMTLPIGYIFDRFGTTAARLLGISFYTTATLMIAFSSAASSLLLYPALCLLAVGGILFLVTNIQVGNLFEKHRSTIITLYNGAFDSSSAVFLIVKVLFEIGISLRSMFLFISSCSVLHLLRTFFLLPRKHIPYPLPEDFTYGVSCETSQSFTPTREGGEGAGPRNRAPQRTTEVLQPAEEPLREGDAEMSFRSCVLSWLFWWQLLWLSVMQLRHYLFIGTLNPMLSRLTEGDPEKISRYTNAFAFTQLCGVLCAPWNGLIMDRHKRGAHSQRDPQNGSARLADLRSSILSLSLTGFQCVLFSVCAAVPVLPLQYLTFILQVLNRSFLYGGNAAFIIIAFPPRHFGKLYGLVMSLSAVVSLLQYPCFILVKGPLQGDPLYVNVALIAVTLLAFVHPVNVYLHCRRETKQRETAAHTH
ncbi:equilibrative nucleobase transporter 1-like isoform X2 [Acipenser ruthenus]|uniref:equilibrative nucleobase transporter 1-like isoform X2 n=1 Tax=Acipenser ruthenus TaxID=7906 RepID=UPI0027405C20|nr:equilibrative nucleobase transporter 1-like isoform X2 [Acipenser ruthenus]